MSKKNEDQTVEDLIEEMPEERKEAVKKIRQLLQKHLPKGFEETISYRMMAYVVPHSVYPDGYHVNPEEPLPFISIASQKKHLALYHMGLYANDELLDWFTKEYKEQTGTKPNMGKSCLRFTNPEKIPYDLLSELFERMTPREWISIYEEKIR